MYHLKLLVIISSFIYLVLSLFQHSSAEFTSEELMNFQSNDTTGQFKNNVLSRNRRQLIFPVQTLIQLSFCYVSPADIKRNIYVNQGFQLNWLLPNETDQLPSTFFVVPPVINARSRSKRDDQPVEDNYLEKEALEFFNSVSTEQIYYLIETLLNYNGYNGTQCLLNAICHMATIPLEQDGDLFHEIVQFVLTPSEHIKDKPEDIVTQDQNYNSLLGQYSGINNPVSFSEYHEAELLGQALSGDHNAGVCDGTYQCPHSPLAQYTHVLYDDMIIIIICDVVMDEHFVPLKITPEKAKIPENSPYLTPAVEASNNN